MYPIRVLRQMGIQAAILTNAAGAINLNFRQGALVAIRDHLNLSDLNPLIGPNDASLRPSISGHEPSLLREISPDRR